MDGELGAMLQSVLSDPQQMETIARMARGLMGEMPQQEGEREEAAEKSSGKTEVGPAGVESKLFSTLGTMFAGRQDKSRSTALLMAMRPYMRPEKQEKLDRAMKITQMVHIAGAVMGEYGGGFSGL